MFLCLCMCESSLGEKHSSTSESSQFLWIALDNIEARDLFPDLMQAGSHFRMYFRFRVCKAGDGIVCLLLRINLKGAFEFIFASKSLAHKRRLAVNVLERSRILGILSGGS